LGTQQFGKGMIFAAWILFLALLTLAFSSLLERQKNPNRDLASRVEGDGIPQAVLKRNRSGHYVATGSINGFPVTFLLDTGATDVALPSSVADRLGLKRGAPVLNRTANGQVTSWRTRLDEVRLGPIHMRGVRASILPSMNGSEVLLGMSFLKHLEMIQRDGTMTLRQF
jgi:aspartyl protease family protein